MEILWYKRIVKALYSPVHYSICRKNEKYICSEQSNCLYVLTQEERHLYSGFIEPIRFWTQENNDTALTATKASDCWASILASFSLSSAWQFWLCTPNHSVPRSQANTIPDIVSAWRGKDGDHQNGQQAKPVVLYTKQVAMHLPYHQWSGLMKQMQ